jgi:AmmeMemoRadiSam system protein A
MSISIMDALTPKIRRFLLDLARSAIEKELTGATSLAVSIEDAPPALHEDGASFVTLHKRSGALRGCIGSLVARRPLIEDVQANAKAAAFQDPRFPPLREEELADIVIEVSILSAPEPLAYDGPEELIKKLRPHIDGVVLERGWNRATFLPQVWEQLPEPEKFLAHLCYKAGLSPDAWRNQEVKISIYQVEKFSEEEFESLS